MKTLHPCYACETGMVSKQNLRGRQFSYRDEPVLEFAEDLEAPICNKCGELYLRGDVAKQFNTTLERLRIERKREAARHFVQAAQKHFAGIPRRKWEALFGLSPGYISRLESGTRTADGPLAIILEGFARDPGMALQLIAASGRVVPDEIRAVVPKRVSARR